MKKSNLIKTVGSIALVMSMLSVNVSAVTLYTKDGRSKDFPKEKVEAQLKVGWYKEPVVKMYALDGRSKYVEKSKVDANKKVGWYNGKPVKMYALDGRTKYVGENEVDANKKVGWYNGKPVKLYAQDGRTKYVGENEVAANEKVGWYSEPFQMLYAPGKSKLLKKSEVAAQKSVGWYEYPVITMYAKDGRTAVVAKSEVQAWKNVGWYDYDVRNTANQETNKKTEKSETVSNNSESNAAVSENSLYKETYKKVKNYLINNGTSYGDGLYGVRQWGNTAKNLKYYAYILYDSNDDILCLRGDEYRVRNEQTSLECTTLIEMDSEQPKFRLAFVSGDDIGISSLRDNDGNPMYMYFPFIEYEGDESNRKTHEDRAKIEYALMSYGWKDLFESHGFDVKDLGFERWK